jgi:hypothetical protein
MTKHTATLLVAAGAIAGMAAFSQPAAAAIEYPWCAEYGGHDGGAENCGFVTLEQCRATVSGIGGFCQRNLRYNEPANPVRHKRKHTEG